MLCPQSRVRNVVVDLTLRLQRSAVFILLQSASVFDVACKGCGASCQGCTFGESPVVPICAQTMEHSTSSGRATTLTGVSINRGFWRATSNSEDVLPCYREEACHGGVTGSPEYCRIGYEGPCERRRFAPLLGIALATSKLYASRYRKENDERLSENTALFLNHTDVNVMCIQIVSTFDYPT